MVSLTVLSLDGPEAHALGDWAGWALGALQDGGEGEGADWTEGAHLSFTGAEPAAQTSATLKALNGWQGAVHAALGAAAHPTANIGEHHYVHINNNKLDVNKRQNHNRQTLT